MGEEFIRIGEVTARTGLTERAVRLYEKRGLVRSARSAAGQRLFGPSALQALAIVRILKRAGFSLAEIENLLASSVDTKSLVKSQLESLKAEATRITDSIRLLETIELELSAGAASVDLLCRLIEAGERCEPTPAWREVFDRHFSAKSQAGWVKLQAELKAKVDPRSYNDAWLALIEEIKAALPLDPRSAKAGALLDLWDALLAPFNKIATADQKRQARAFWSNADAWAGKVNHPMTGAVAEFIRRAREVRQAGNVAARKVAKRKVATKKVAKRGKKK